MKFTQTQMLLAAGGSAVLLAAVLTRKSGSKNDAIISQIAPVLTLPKSKAVLVLPPFMYGTTEEDPFSDAVTAPLRFELPTKPGTSAEQIREWIRVILLPSPPEKQWDDEASKSSRAQRNNLIQAADLATNFDPEPWPNLGLWNWLWAAVAMNYFVTEDMTGQPEAARWDELVAIFVAALAVDLMHSNAAEIMERRFLTLNNLGDSERRKQVSNSWKARKKGDVVADALRILELALDHALSYSVPAELQKWAEMTAWELLAQAVVTIGVAVADAYSSGAASKAKAGLEQAAQAAKDAAAAAASGDINGARAAAVGALTKTKKALGEL